MNVAVSATTSIAVGTGDVGAQTGRLGVVEERDAVASAAANDPAREFPRPGGDMDVHIVGAVTAEHGVG
jgi:DICT domain-containing protein